jgi:4-amino-4-deoxychorismate lyase
MPDINVLDTKTLLERLKASQGRRSYGAMYSSFFGGITKDVSLMVVPVDDHLVHRGDGIFEMIYFRGDRFFEFEPHLDRLWRSSDMIGLKIPVSRKELVEICHAVVLEAGMSPTEDGNLRIFVSRGPGDFSPNPYSTIGEQLYVLAMKAPPRKNSLYEKGATLVVSTVEVKPGLFARVKSCNYLPNVMTKKDAMDRGADFAINLNDGGEVAEGPTENILVLTAARDLVAPPFDYTLRGTTLLRVLEIAQKLKQSLDIKSVCQRPLHRSDLESAHEIMMVGTSLGVCPVTQFEGQNVGPAHGPHGTVGTVGPVARTLHGEILKLMHGV